MAVSSGGWRATPPEQAYSLVISAHPREVEASVSWTHHQASLQPWVQTAWFPASESQMKMVEPTGTVIQMVPSKKLPSLNHRSWTQVGLIHWSVVSLFSYTPAITMVSANLIADSILQSSSQERRWHQVDGCHGYSDKYGRLMIISWQKHPFYLHLGLEWLLL